MPAHTPIATLMAGVNTTQTNTPFEFTAWIGKIKVTQSIIVASFVLNLVGFVLNWVLVFRSAFPLQRFRMLCQEVEAIHDKVNDLTDLVQKKQGESPLTVRRIPSWDSLNRAAAPSGPPTPLPPSPPHETIRQRVNLSRRPEIE